MKAGLWRIVVALLGLVAPVALAAAQAPLEVIRQEPVADVPGLRILTIRDNQLGACYSLFVMEPASSGEAVLSTATPVETPEQESARRVREMTDEYQYQLDSLNADFQRSVGRPPRETWNNLVGWPYTFTSVVQYELER